MFEDKILLSIKRSYSKDEKFAFILDQLGKAQVENEKLRAYTEELEDKIKNLHAKVREYKKNTTLI